MCGSLRKSSAPNFVSCPDAPCRLRRQAGSGGSASSMALISTPGAVQASAIRSIHCCLFHNPYAALFRFFLPSSHHPSAVCWSSISLSLHALFLRCLFRAPRSITPAVLGRVCCRFLAPLEHQTHWPSPPTVYHDQQELLCLPRQQRRRRHDFRHKGPGLLCSAQPDTAPRPSEVEGDQVEDTQSTGSHLINRRARDVMVAF